MCCFITACSCAGLNTAESIPSQEGGPEVAFSDYLKVVPGDGLPTEVSVNRSNNNLDVARHEGRLFFAFRTAPSHFASPQTRMYVLSSSGQSTWEFEAKFERGTDLREPRFLSFNGRLFLYLAELGKEPTSFEPGRTLMTERLGLGQWTDPRKVHVDDFIVWRARTIGSVPYIIGYHGGENIYNLSGDPITIQLLTTTDGEHFEGINSRQYVSRGGGSETDFAFDEAGNLFAVVRNEAGDETGWGSKICKAGRNDITEWTCKPDPRKFDSPLVFRHGAEIYLIARRNVTESGHYDLGLRDLSAKEQTAAYLADYSGNPKRCSVWRFDRDALGIVWLLDLPSKGDTCFASIVQDTARTYTVFNYTSPPDREDVSWIEGQLRETLIYSGTLTFGR